MYAHEYWHDYMRGLVARLHSFVSRNKSECLVETPERVRRTMQFVDQLLGRALSCVQDDSPQWWYNFCEVAREIDYESRRWSMALFELQHAAPRAATPHQERGSTLAAPGHDRKQSR
ncbi:hypothetical protein Gpo141_00013646 [Globisporangium polare]